ncbi:hypothetical protein D3C72_921470 [compost metagenome]
MRRRLGAVLGESIFGGGDQPAGHQRQAFESEVVLYALGLRIVDEIGVRQFQPLHIAAVDVRDVKRRLVLQVAFGGPIELAALAVERDAFRIDALRRKGRAGLVFQFMGGGDVERGGAFRYGQLQLVIAGRTFFHAIIGNCEITARFAVEGEIGNAAEGNAIDGEARGNDDLAEEGRRRRGLGSGGKSRKTAGGNGDDAEHGEGPSCGG